MCDHLGKCPGTCMDLSGYVCMYVEWVLFGSQCVNVYESLTVCQCVCISICQCVSVSVCQCV